MRKMFCGANSPKGFYGFYDRLIDMYGLKRMYILKGGSGIGKSTFIKKFGEKVINGSDSSDVVDWLYCSGDPKSLDGLIIRSRGIGIIDGTSPHMVDPIYSGIIDEIVNLGEFIKRGKVKGDKDALKKLRAEKKLGYELASKELSKLKRPCTPCELAKVNRTEEDRLYREIMRHVSPVAGEKIFVDMFARSITADGVIDFWDSLVGSENYFWVQADTALGHKVFERVYKEFGGYAFRSFLHPELIEGIQAGGVVFSTASVEGCKKIELKTQSLEIKTREEDEIIRNAVKHLYRAREVHEEIEALYQGAVNWDGVEQTLMRVIKEC
jgi:hypothetical protein